MVRFYQQEKFNIIGVLDVFSDMSDISELCEEVSLKAGGVFPNSAFLFALQLRLLPGRSEYFSVGGGLCSRLIFTGGDFAFFCGELKASVFNKIQSITDLPRSMQIILLGGSNLDAGGLSKFAANFRFRHYFCGLSLKRAIKISLTAYKVQRITQELLLESHWKEKILALFGSPEQYEKHGLGYGVLYQGRLISEAYVVQGGGIAELGIFTDPEYRGQGFAKMVCQHLLLDCLQRGWVPSWSCMVENQASARLATSLGLRYRGTYPVLII